MMINIRRAAAALGLAAALSHSAGAQALGPQRQFLAIEPYYEYTRLYLSHDLGHDDLSGFGGRLWINLDPFHFILNSSISVYGSYAPSQGNKYTSMATVGATYDQFFVRRPLGGIIDPFVTVGGGGVFITNERGTITGALKSTQYYPTMTFGGGVRIPMPNRFELRLEGKDLAIFNAAVGTNHAKKTTNNLQLQAGLGITF